ncbi:GxxExxY protein [uncultured Desulfuromonas sp.]|uniref:GxxExxY protein n=1 Tax=uncultured Desulfuromonas sp. TaxID=181013 RepID=UPI00262349FD|nr:GxxExxY protein [uncultured Desulfuromonas sp.]
MKFEDQISNKILLAAIEVHRALGPGLLESAYEECLFRELQILGLSVDRQRALPVTYKGFLLDCGYRLDLVVEDVVIIELKAVHKIEPIHEAQMLTYLKMSELKLGLLLNFNVPLMRDGIRRIVHNL